MSLVTTVTLIGCDEDIQVIIEVTGRCFDRLIRESSGDKYPQVSVIVGAFNYFDTDRFKADLRKAKLEDMVTVVMVTEDQEHVVIQL